VDYSSLYPQGIAVDHGCSSFHFNLIHKAVSALRFTVVNYDAGSRDNYGFPTRRKWRRLRDNRLFNDTYGLTAGPSGSD
jgi:hypothetical protein